MIARMRIECKHDSYFTISLALDQGSMASMIIMKANNYFAHLVLPQFDSSGLWCSISFPKKRFQAYIVMY